MKIPRTPPDFHGLFRELLAATDDPTTLLTADRPVDGKSRYLHWDDMWSRVPPDGLTREQWWFESARSSTGRAILGIGKGDSVVAMVGKRPQKHDEFVSSASLLRALLHGESVRLGGYESSLAWLAGHDYAPVPIEIAGAGPRTLAAAATLADRIQLTVGAPPERIRWALDIVSARVAPLRRSVFGPGPR